LEWSLSFGTGKILSQSMVGFPKGWVVIDCDLMEKQNFEFTIGYLKNGCLLSKIRMGDLTKSTDVLDEDRLQRMHGEVEEMLRAIEYLRS
jgi:hypothetical protein